MISENGTSLDLKNDSVTRNDKTGVITISNLVPEQCLEIMEKMHAKKFLGRKIFVTSVVASSPSKSKPHLSESPVDASASIKEKTSASHLPSQPTLDNSSYSAGNQVVFESTTNINNSKILPRSASPVLDPRGASKSTIGQSSNFEEYEFEPPVNFNDGNGDVKDLQFSDMFELNSKRKASLSPETKELTRKDKKAAKREQKVKSKAEQKAKMQLNVSPTKVQ